MSLSDFFRNLKKSMLALLLILILIPSGVFAAKNSNKAAAKGDTPVNASGFEAKDYDLGLSIGIWLPGSVYIEPVDVDKSAGPIFRAFADAYLMPKFAVGAYFNYSSVTLSYRSLEVDANFYEFGISMKPRFIVTSVVAVKPGLNMGYRKGTRERLAGESSTAQTSSNGLGLNLSIEVQYLVSSDYIVFFEGGFLSQPTGGNSDATVTWAPIVYLSAGICF